LNYLLKRLRETESVWCWLNLIEWANWKRVSRSSAEAAFKALVLEGLIVKRVAWVKGRGGSHPLRMFTTPDRLAFDKEPLFFREDGKTPRHVRCSLTDQDLSCETQVFHKNGSSFCSGSRQGIPVVQCPISSVTYKRIQPTVQLKKATSKLSCCEAPSKKLPRSLQRKLFVLLPMLEEIHWQSTGKIPWSKAHAYGYLAKALRDGFYEQTILKVYREAHEQTTADVVDGMAQSPVAYLFWRCQFLLRNSDNLTREERIQRLIQRFNHRPSETVLVEKPLVPKPVTNNGIPVVPVVIAKEVLDGYMAKLRAAVG
jgi:hypothetical protein